MITKPWTLLAALAAVATCATAQVAPASAAPASAQQPGDEVVTLSPFTVQSTQDTGYLATNTLAGTRLNTSLKDVGAAVSVYTPEFLNDIGAHNVQDILTYTLSTEGGGMNGNYSGISGESSDDSRDDPSAVNRIRGLATATRARDYFVSDIPADSYNFESMTISRGPNAVLAGIGAAGGIIDVELRKAQFRDSARVFEQIGNYGSHREELHANRVLVPNRIAFRVDLLNNRDIYRQNPANNTDRRAFVATTIRLRDAHPESFLGRTTVRANVELGTIEGVPPDQLTPSLSLSSWFDNANPAYNKWYANGALQKIYDANGNVLANTATVQGFPLYRNWALIYPDPGSGQASVGFTSPDLSAVQGFMGTIPGGAQGPGGFVRGTGDPNRARAGFYDTHLSDPRVFDFYNQLMTGAFDHRYQSFSAVDARLEQLFMNGNAGVEAAFNYQSFQRKHDFPISGGDDRLYIDVNKYLSIRSAAYPNGIPNPNFGRPFMITRDAFADQVNRSKRTSSQLTGFLKHDFSAHNDSFLSHIVGLNTLSALLFKTKISNFNRTFGSTWDPSGQLNPQTSTGAAPGLYASQVNAWFYLGPSLANASSLADLRLQPITTGRPEFGQTYTLRVYDPTTKQFVTGTSTPLRILRSATDQEQDVTSQALTLQSHWFDNHVTTLVGWRRDKAESYTSSELPRLPNGNLDFSQYALLPSVAQSKSSWTKSVVAVVPRRITDLIPTRPDVRFYWNTSDNFDPVGQRRNALNEELGSPSATTTEYGVMLSLLHGKLDLRINHYRTEIKDASISGVENPFNYISAVIGRMVGANQLGLNPADYGFDYSGFKTFEDVARALYAALPQSFQNNVGLDKNFYPHFEGTGPTLTWQPDNITNYASTSDTISKGMEYELVYNVTPNWRLALNAARSQAVKANVAQLELAFANEWINNLKTMDGGALSRGWRAPPTESGTIVDQYVSEHVAGIATQAALSGTETPEIRKWRVNMVTRYDFRRGFLKGFNVGAAARWQDKVAIGYPFIKNSAGVSVADIAHPYYGPTMLQIDLSVGYQRKFRLGDRTMEWTARVAVRDLNAKDQLIPIAANADGSYGTFRIPPDRLWTFSNSFAF